MEKKLETIQDLLDVLHEISAKHAGALTAAVIYSGGSGHILTGADAYKMPLSAMSFYDVLRLRIKEPSPRELILPNGPFEDESRIEL